jgi:hypothetical protein
LQVAQLTPTRQVAPLQQPLVHEVESHTHAPPTHFCPAWHGAPAPHLQVPPLHVSESFGSHATQAAPLPPQAPSDGDVQVFPAQQPLAQLTLQPVQLPPAHASPALQVEHAEPPAPHALAELPVWQTFA